MPKVKNVAGEDRTSPALGGRLVLAGQVVEVSDEVFAAYNWDVPDTWEIVPAEKPKK